MGPSQLQATFKATRKSVCETVQLLREEQIRAVLAALAPKLRAAPQFRPQHVAAALYGLRFVADSKAVRAVLAALTEKVRTGAAAQRGVCNSAHPR